MDFDLDDPQASPALRDGEVGLWIAVFVDACECLLNGWTYQDQARSFIFDDSGIMDAVADALGYEADGLRKRVLKALERPRGDRRTAWQSRIRQRMENEDNKS